MPGRQVSVSDVVMRHCWKHSPAPKSPGGLTSVANSTPLECHIIRKKSINLGYRKGSMFCLHLNMTEFIEICTRSFVWAGSVSLSVFSCFTKLQNNIVTLTWRYACPGSGGGCCPVGGYRPWGGRPLILSPWTDLKARKTRMSTWKLTVHFVVLSSVLKNLISCNILLTSSTNYVIECVNFFTTVMVKFCL